MRIIKATDAEKKAYFAQTPTPQYPLYGTVKLGDHVVAIEYLGGWWDREDPQYEAIAPDGYIFSGYEVHTLLGTTLADLKDRLAGGLVRCGESCCNQVD